MRKRPIVIILLSILFILIGAGGLIAAAFPFLNAQNLTRHEMLDSLYVAIGGVLALLGGVLAFQGRNLGRWLCVLWMAAHVVLSFWHPWDKLVVHGIMLLILIYLFFFSRAAHYFRHV
jgi:predicted ABC-type sugar transport system permease subunit